MASTRLRRVRPGSTHPGARFLPHAGPTPLFAHAWRSPLGPVVVAVDDAGVVGIDLPAPSRPIVDRLLDGGVCSEVVWERRPDATSPVVDALQRYFEGDADSFAGLPLAPSGTAFQLAVWEACARIPFGQTRSYGEVAMMAGNPAAARAVGGAMNRNPLPLIVPCHRVVASGGSLGGYGGGEPLKRWLLHHEGHTRYGGAGNGTRRGR